MVQFHGHAKAESLATSTLLGFAYGLFWHHLKPRLVETQGFIPSAFGCRIVPNHCVTTAVAGTYDQRECLSNLFTAPSLIPTNRQDHSEAFPCLGLSGFPRAFRKEQTQSHCELEKKTTKRSGQVPTLLVRQAAGGRRSRRGLEAERLCCIEDSSSGVAESRIQPVATADPLSHLFRKKALLFLWYTRSLTQPLGCKICKNCENKLLTASHHSAELEFVLPSIFSRDILSVYEFLRQIFSSVDPTAWESKKRILTIARSPSSRHLPRTS